MNRKQKKRNRRIGIALVAFAALLLLKGIGKLDALPGIALFAVYFIPYLVVGADVILRAVRNIAKGQVFDENFLMMVATFAAFGLGLFGDVQYSEALAVMLFYQIGEAFQDYAVGKSRASITEMMDIAPEYANLERNGETEAVDPEDVHPGDVIVVRPGEKVPLDGIVREGTSFLDTAALTGESVPRRVSEGEEVVSGCLNGASLLRVEVTKEYEDSTVARILDLVENASGRKARLENLITRFARVYTPIVTVAAVLLAVLAPILFGTSYADGIKRACNFLIVSCPCALVISVPLGFFGGIGAASRRGVLVKGSNYLEAASRLRVLLMDKTGTLTTGELKVRKAVPSENFRRERAHPEQELLTLAAYGEAYSTHPIAQSIAAEYGDIPDLKRLTAVEEEAGCGVRALLDGKPLLVGNARLMAKDGIAFSDGEIEGPVGTLVHIAYEGSYAGFLLIADEVKEGAEAAISALKKEGMREIVMLTGDRRAAAEAVAARIGIDEVRSELLPQDKVSAVEERLKHLSSAGGGETLGFVGDGINDAPVLMRADVGIAMGSLGSDVAIEAADLVIMDDDLAKLPLILRIARKTMRIVKGNITFALLVKAVILLLSAAGLASMWAAVFGDVGVSVLCILNAMRALRTK